MPTIKDIAREAGVSHGTVSNVLNKTGKVSSEKIRLVEEAVRKLGYIPNTQAQKLRQGNNNTIILILPSLENEFYARIHSIITSFAKEKSILLNLQVTGDTETIEEEIIEDSLRQGIIAVLTVTSLGSRATERYSAFNAPVIFIDRCSDITGHPDFYNVSIDQEQAGMDVASHIQERNDQKVCFFSSPHRFKDDEKIYKTLESTLPSNIELVHESSDRKANVIKAFKIMSEEKSYDSIVACSLNRAVALETARKEKGVCKDTNIILLKNSSNMDFPFFDCYEIDYTKLAMATVDLLDKIANGTMPKEHEILISNPGFRKNLKVTTQDSCKLRLLTLDSPSTKALKELLPKLKRETGIDLQITAVDFNSLREQIIRINPYFNYDLIRLDVAWTEFLNDKLFMDLKAMGIADSGILERLLRNNLYMNRQNIHTLPFDPSTLMLFYRQDLFSDALMQRSFYEKEKRTLEPPKTMEDLIKIARFFTRSENPESPTQYGITDTNGSMITAASELLPFVQTYQAIYEDEGRIIFNIEKLSKAMDEYVDLQRYTGHEHYKWWGESIRQLILGKTAMAISYSNHYTYLSNADNSFINSRINVAALPGDRGVIGGGEIGISRYSSNAEAAMNFLKWYYSAEVSNMLVALGGTSALNSAYEEPVNLVQFPLLPTIRESMNTGVRGFSGIKGHYSNYELELALGMAINEVLEGRMSSLEASEYAEHIYNSQITL